MEQYCDIWTLFQMNLRCDNLTMAMNAPLRTPATKINVFCSGGSNCVGHLYNSIMCPRSYKRCLIPPVTILTIEINCGAAFSSQISTLGAGSGDMETRGHDSECGGDKLTAVEFFNVDIDIECVP